MAARKPRKKRTTYHHGDLKHALVRAALDIVSTGSVEQITLREVSRRVGVNHRAVYRHFEDLTSLLAAVAEEGYRMLLGALDEALVPLKRSGPDRRLEALGVAYVAFAVDHPAHYRIMFGRRLNEDGRFNELEALAEQAYAVLAGEVRSGQASGRLVDLPLRETVFALWSLTHGFASLALVNRIRVKRPLLEAYTRQILAPFLVGLRK